jgi:hypothetical protein
VQPVNRADKNAVSVYAGPSPSIGSASPPAVRLTNSNAS